MYKNLYPLTSAVLAIVTVLSCGSVAAEAIHKLGEQKRIGYEKVSDVVSDKKTDNTDNSGRIPCGVVADVQALPQPKGLYNGWCGYVDDKWYTIWSGYAFSDPLHGLLIIMDGDDYRGGEYRPGKATGPLEITGEHNGILTLRSKSGTYYVAQNLNEDVSRRKTMSVAGGATYHFDIRTRKFE